ncbi:hypothetical protein NDU88_001651 [Pleurodeles waltl]|uniref:Uncharacterized protein n=1 Tax=Pleurodeles waltl TaxID=8319 RepID=A0AAV7NKT3_PLEWA|nr:hypothetical protein NDU88_001651 [Pleurodeles waltl]
MLNPCTSSGVGDDVVQRLPLSRGLQRGCSSIGPAKSVAFQRRSRRLVQAASLDSAAASVRSRPKSISLDFHQLSFQGPRDWIGHHLSEQESLQRLQVLAERSLCCP